MTDKVPYQDNNGRSIRMLLAFFGLAFIEMDGLPVIWCMEYVI
jgi:hypothetical protein